MTNITDKIRALVAKAESTEHEPERDAFMAKAIDLAARHAINIDHIGEDPNSTAHEMGVETIIVDLGKGTGGLTSLWFNVGCVFDCFALPGRRIQKAEAAEKGVSTLARTVRLFGTEQNRQLTKLVVESLKIQMIIDMKKAKPRSRKAFCIAWADTATDKLEEAHQTARKEEGAEPNSLEPLSAMTFARSQGVRWTNGGSERLDLASMNAGERAGSRADVSNGSSRVGSTRTMQLTA